MFSENATYVIAGGLGGLGRSVVKWMVDRKARNFILLSRSGIDRNEAAQDLVEEMRPLGVRIEAPRCDITDEQAVSTVLVAIKDSLPPVKGLIQASMVLNVSSKTFATVFCTKANVRNSGRPLPAYVPRLATLRSPPQNSRHY